MQTRIGSFIEVALNILVGITVAFATQKLVFPLYDLEVSNYEHFQITIFFTVVSIVRGYVIRRYFNGLKIFTAKKVA